MHLKNKMEVNKVEEKRKYEKPKVLTYSEHEIIKERAKLDAGYIPR